VKVDVPFGHPRWGSIEPCACWLREGHAERHDRLLRYSNLGLLARFTFESLDAKGRSADQQDQALFQDAARECAAFAEAPSGWLVLEGPSGCGKTHLAAAVAHRAVEHGHPALFMVVPDLLDHLRAPFSGDSSESYDMRIEQVSGAPVLVLDDVGAAAATPWAQEKLLQVLNYRYNLELPTLVTLAAPLEAVDERLATRLTSGPSSRVLLLAAARPKGARSLGSMPATMRRELSFEAFKAAGNKADARQRSTLEAALGASRSFAQDPEGQWLVLGGATGVGKTHLAAAIVNRRHAEGHPAFFAFVPELLDYLRYTFAPSSSITYDELFERVKNTPLLVLDDLGAQSTTPWAQEKLYQLLVHRHNARLPTVVTVQKDAQLDEAVASRLADTRFVMPLEIEAPDFRDQSPRPRGGRRRSRDE
jgi:DNA replication protein DnaC